MMMRVCMPTGPRALSYTHIHIYIHSLPLFYFCNLSVTPQSFNCKSTYTRILNLRLYFNIYPYILAASLLIHKKNN